MQLFHGTANEFDEFDIGRAGSGILAENPNTDDIGDVHGIYLTPNREIASMYSSPDFIAYGEGVPNSGNVYTVDAQFKKVYDSTEGHNGVDLRWDRSSGRVEPVEGKELADKLRSLGYDAIKTPNTLELDDETKWEYASLDPSNLTITHKNGVPFTPPVTRAKPEAAVAEAVAKNDYPHLTNLRANVGRTVENLTPLIDKAAYGMHTRGTRVAGVLMRHPKSTIAGVLGAGAVAIHHHNKNALENMNNYPPNTTMRQGARPRSRSAMGGIAYL